MTVNQKSLTDYQSDKRYFPRWAVRNRTMFRLHGENQLWHEVQTRDLSCAGVCLATDRNLVLGQSLRLKIYLSDEVVIAVDGHVAWIRAMDLNESLMGVIFTNITKEDQDVILNHAFDLNPEKLNDLWFKGWS